MKKLKRSARLADMMQYLIRRPHQLIPLTLFKERYQAAKSSISEDLQIIKETMDMSGLGELLTVPGAAGGVKYIPAVDLGRIKSWVEELRAGLEDPDRLLPGGYLYMSDYLSQPQVVNRIGQIFSSQFRDSSVDYVITVETKGIPLAYATSQYLNVPFVIVRRDHRVTEGSVVSINYVSGSTKRIQTMSLARRSMKPNSKVLIVDDFMKAGGTIRGMMDLLKEFEAEVAGACVFVESLATTEKLVENVYSLLRLGDVDIKERTIAMQLGSIFDHEL
ncbi:purine operon repressor [Caldalkalibacillus uzonensis]|uniref:Purine operon repressor n=1 Tax=Caldalkalibacillus uzonensis TaxID=353224 RepID=A0ABU0CW37_9BACI|nr:pur operon repressor [Caldalkalibacillus uzonensis]MDQ0340633.1 purine operon repressor [Caldalkalibacillus uzonensis]